MSGQRQKTRPEQEVLAFAVEGRRDAPKTTGKGSETLVAKRKSENLAGTERLMEEVCELETASRHYNESRPTQKRWDPTFSEHSHGFRPGRSARQAVREAQQYIC
jgi:hypothetical protein